MVFSVIGGSSPGPQGFDLTAPFCKLSLVFSKFRWDELILGCLSSDGFNQLSVDEENKSEVTELNNGIVCQPRHLARDNSRPVHHHRPGALIGKVKFSRVLEFDDGLSPRDLAGRAF